MIHLITGCMGSGKTERLINLADQVPDVGKLILALGKRDGYTIWVDKIVSRNKRWLWCSNVPVAQKLLIEVPRILTDVFIDEGQWISQERIINAKRLSDRGA